VARPAASAADGVVADEAGWVGHPDPRYDAPVLVLCPRLANGDRVCAEARGYLPRRHSISRRRSPNIVGRSSFEAQAHEDDLRVMKGKVGGITGGDGSTKTFQIGQKPLRRPHVQTRVSRVVFFGGGGSFPGVNRVLATERNCGVSREVEG
jgi:hypothetical protein